jgi:hypothetical protein
MRTWFGAAILLISCTHAGLAQTAVQVSDDNDFFNFWQPFATRPDVDYTQGLRITLTWSAPTPHLVQWLGHANPCTDATPLASACSRLSLGVGQNIYTPWYDVPLQGFADHPFAGWLYLRGEARQESDRRVDAVSVTLGVTGPPALAGAVQDAWHKLFGFRNIEGWDAQLPFEPGVIVGYEGARQLFAAGTDGLGVRVVPHWNVHLGNISTNADIGADVVAGLRPPVPWSTPRRDSHRSLGVFVRASAVGTAVLRDEFLDGSTFRTSAHVQKKTFVGVASVGVGIRVGRVMMEWEAHDQSLTFNTQPEPHVFSTIGLTIQ